MFLLIDIFAQNKSTKKYSEVLGAHELMPATSKQYDPAITERIKAGESPRDVLRTEKNGVEL
jgi:phosphonate transport system substrate-binding protein